VAYSSGKVRRFRLGFSLEIRWNVQVSAAYAP
jgi:hypothetical protein